MTGLTYYLRIHMLIRVVHMYLRYHVLCVSILDRFYRFFGCFYSWILEHFDYSLFYFMFLVVSIIFLSVIFASISNLC